MKQEMEFRTSGFHCWELWSWNSSAFRHDHPAGSVVPLPAPGPQPGILCDHEQRSGTTERILQNELRSRIVRVGVKKKKKKKK